MNTTQLVLTSSEDLTNYIQSSYFFGLWNLFQKKYPSFHGQLDFFLYYFTQQRDTMQFDLGLWRWLPKTTLYQIYGNFSI